MAKYCVPTLSSLPGSPASDFDWWTNPPDPALIRYYPDNPNWLGAFALSQGNGANRDVLFRTLKGNLGGVDYLFLQWISRTSTKDINIDRVRCVIGPPGGNYLSFMAKLNSTSSTVAGTQNNNIYKYAIQSCTAGGGTITKDGVQVQSDGDIEATGRMWVDVTSPTRQISAVWAFQVAIKLGAAWGGPGLATQLNLPLAGDFNVWFEVQIAMGLAKVPFQWPTAAPSTVSGIDIFPAGLTEAQMMNMSTGAVGCTTEVKLDWGNIGTRAAPGGMARADQNTIKLDLGKPYPPNNKPYDENYTPDVLNAEHQNTFFAKPTFPGGFSQPQRESVRSTFSIANWGSQFSDPSPASWRPIPGGTDVQYLDANTESRTVWPKAGEDVTVGNPGSFLTPLVRNINKYLNAYPGPFPAGAQNPHQCMLVEISSTDPNVVFTTSSIYTNMNVANASTFRRLAEISVVGAPPIDTKPRDVYLYVQKFNMPPVVTGKEPPPGVIGVAFNRDNFSLASTQSRPREVEDIAGFIPTCTYHAYIDTGKKYKQEDGVEIPILRPQTAFGYFVQHEGDLYGWETRLNGAEKIAENLYVVRVPNNGSVQVETVIQGRASESEAPLPPDEQTKPPKGKGCPLGCLGSILTLFGIGRQ